MRHSTINMLVLCLFMLLSQITFADDDVSVLSTLCDIELLDGTSAACEEYLGCAVVEESGYPTEAYIDNECTLDLFENILNLCASPDCEKDALISIATIEVTLQNYFEYYEFDYDEHERFEQEIVKALTLYQYGHYQGAGETFLDLFYDYRYRYLAYAAGLSFEEAGSVIDALASYQLSILMQFFNPLAYYSRGKYHLELGNEELASRDFYTYLGIQSDDIYFTQWLPIPEGITPYTMPDNHEHWTQYDVLVMVYGIAAHHTQYTDTMSYDGENVEVAWLDDGKTLAIKGLPYGEKYYIHKVPEVLFIPCTNNICSQSLNFQWPRGKFGTSFTIDFNQSPAQVKHHIIFRNSYSVILPSSEPDPRPEKTCEYGVHSRLNPGDIVNLAGVWSVQIYTEPSKESEVVRELDFAEVYYLRTEDIAAITIVGLMECNEEGNWWFVMTNEHEFGWALESMDNIYILVTPDIEYTIFDFDSD